MEKSPTNLLEPGSFFSRSSLLEGNPSFSKISDLTETQEQVDSLVGGFVHQATDWRSLAAMMAGGMAYRFGRIGVMSVGTGNVARLFSVGIGLGTEVTAFEMTNRSLTSLAGGNSQNPNLWRWGGQGGIRQGLLSSLITFGTLKGAGRLAQGENIVVQHLLQDMGMVLGHQVSGALNITPRQEGSLAEQFLHAEVTNLQLGAGMALAHRFAPWMYALERGVDLSLRNISSPLSLSLDLARHFGPAFATGHGENIPEFPKGPNILMMANGKEGSSGRWDDLMISAPPSVKKIAEELNADGVLSPMLLFHWVVDDLLKNGASSLSPREKKFLKAVANRQMDEYEKKRGRFYLEEEARHQTGDSWYLARRIFWQLNDFPGIQRLALALEDQMADKWEAHMVLEDYEEAFRVFDLSVKDFYKGMPDLNRIFCGLQDLAYRHLHDFADRRGYEEWGLFSLDKTAVALTQLSSTYDLVVPIARGGIFSGAVADLLGLPVRVIEVHAHDRAHPISKFIDEIRPEDIAGKRILFVDKDTVTGASIREAVRLITPYRPAAMGVFFNYNVGEIIPTKTAKELRGLGIALHFPDEAELVPTLPLFYSLHERLNTTLGRFRKALRGLEELIPSVRDIDPEAETVIRKYIDRQKKVFFVFNPWLLGVDEIRSTLSSRLEILLAHFLESRSFDEVRALNHLLGLIKIDPPLPTGYIGDLANGRYRQEGIRQAEKRGVENIHFPHSYAASFRAAQKALKDKYDVALIVGPEGFAYEPIFRDLGLPTLAVNIPEADFGGRRSIAIFDDLMQLKGKRVLVIEDDVQSGATLQKLLEEIRPYGPKYLGLYLGLPAIHQIRKNIPPDFRKIYVTEIDSPLDEAAFLRHLRKREVVFKTTPP